MKTFEIACICFSLIIISVCAVTTTIHFNKTLDSLDSTIKQGQVVFTDLSGVVVNLNSRVNQLGSLISGFDSTKSKINSLIDRIPQVVTEKSNEMQNSLNAKFDPIDQAIKKFPAVVQHADDVVLASKEAVVHTDKLVKDATPFTLGVLGASKSLIGDFAESSKLFRKDWPHILHTFDQIQDNVKRGTDASVDAANHTNELTANLAKATKPLPAWMRIGLAIAPPMVQTGSSIITTLAIRGRQN